MIVFLLLVIIAILLMGASRFIGMVGAILGFVVLVIAVGIGVGTIAKSTDTDEAYVFIYIMAGIGILAPIGWMIAEGQKPIR